jgi:AcrR family transcriptional regulator
MTTKPARRPGRPRAGDAPVSLDAMLAAALTAFATNGYDGVSVTALGRELGVSHSLLHQRFGSKIGLWHAAVDWGFGGLADELAKAADPTLSDPLDQLVVILRRFLEVSAERPELVGLMNLEGRESSERLTYLFTHYVEPITAPIARVLEHLAAEGRIRPVSQRAFLFLVAHGAAAPFTLKALARELEPSDPLDPAEREAYIDMVLDVLLSGIRLERSA